MRKRSSANEESVALGEDVTPVKVEEKKNPFEGIVNALKEAFKKKEEKPQEEEKKDMKGDLGLN